MVKEGAVNNYNLKIVPDILCCKDDEIIMKTEFNTLGVSFLTTVEQTSVHVNQTQPINFPAYKVEYHNLKNNDVYPITNWVFEIPEGKFTIGFSEGKLKCSPYIKEAITPQWNGLFADSIENGVALVNSGAAEFCIVDSINAKYQYALIFKAEGKLMYRPFDVTTHGYKNFADSIHGDVQSFYQNCKTYAHKYASPVPVSA